MAIADGMGGHRAGEIASRMVTDELEEYFKVNRNENLFEKTQDIENLIKAINEKIIKHASDCPDCSGMGTTMTLCIADETVADVFHIGDSRAYIVNENITQITKDHSLVQMLIDQGQLTNREAKNHPRKNVITRALGIEDEIEVDCFTISLQQNDKILLCSDGLTNMLTNSEIHEIAASSDAEAAVDLLIREANKKGGIDNITVIIAQNQEAV